MTDSFVWGGKSKQLYDTLFRVPRQNGLQSIQISGEGGSKELSSWRVRLDPGESVVFRPHANEAVFVLQEGVGNLQVADQEWEIARMSVFAERATALYVPPRANLVIAATDRLEGIIVTAPTEEDGSPALIGPEQVTVNQRGADNYAREVHDLFVSDPFAKRLMVGETYNPPGNWSGYPPHKHDGADGEPRLEEVYYYRVDPASGFGHQALYTAGGESITHMVRDGDAVTIPYGYHPVSAPPGYRLYYLWALVGEQRKLAVFEDPQHSWISAK
jgi:5-deoxy-glucuronate isomerase